jgi:hypothetical protein
MDKTEQHKKAMLDALEKSLGVVTSAAKTVGVGRTTHYLWMQEDKEYKAAVDELSDVAIDFAESQLHKQINRYHLLSEDQRQEAWVCGTPRGRRIFGQAISN